MYTIEREYRAGKDYNITEAGTFVRCDKDGREWNIVNREGRLMVTRLQKLIEHEKNHKANGGN